MLPVIVSSYNVNCVSLSTDTMRDDILSVSLFAAMLLGGVTAGFAQAPGQLSASHILIQYDGASRASKSVTRSKAEALELATSIAEMARAEDADFAALAEKYSDSIEVHQRLDELLEAEAAIVSELPVRLALH